MPAPAAPVPLRLADILEACGAELAGDLPAEGVFAAVDADPGRIAPGDLYVAVPGTPVDGHDLVPVAALRGAAAALVARRWARHVARRPLPLLLVDDPVAALGALAAARRRRMGGTVVGVTGSVGKTGVKELAASVLARRLRTHRNPGNRNNEVGLPLSLLAAPEDTEVTVLEMAGGYAAGEIARLADIARPSVAVVTAVRAVHVARMGSVEAIAATKAELVEAVPATGAAVLNAGDRRVASMAARCRGRVVTYGIDRRAEVRAVDVRVHGLSGSSFGLELAGERHPVRLPLLGPHAVELALAAAAVGHVMGLAPALVADALAAPGPPLRLRALRGRDGCVVIDDSYSASPPAVASALAVLRASGARRRIAVLGDMRELGPLARPEHRRMAALAAGACDVLIAYGACSRLVAREAAARARGARRVLATHAYAEGEADALLAVLERLVRRGDAVLVKGSRALEMQRFVAALVPSGPP